MSIFSDLGIREGKDRLGEEVLYNLAMCYSLAERRVASVIGPYGLSPVKINTLLIIKHIGKKKGIQQNEISRRMIVTAGNITRLLDRLEKEKLIQRIPQEHDRRIKLIRVTKKASDLLDRVWPIYKKEVNKLMSELPQIKLRQTAQNLELLRKKLDNHKDK